MGKAIQDAGVKAERRKQRFVIFAASLGTVFEWYDFYLYGSLAIFFSGLFYPPGSETGGLLASLATFGVGFAIRPLGALVFGRLGDMAGRKNTFLMTIILMGISTTAVGILPGFAQIGWSAPIILLLLRMVQGLALGGEFGGASVYVAEHTVAAERGFKTSWLQMTAPLGFLMAIAVTLGFRSMMSAEAFAAWGWRLPFMVSLPLLAVSVFLRTKLHESPVYLAMKAEGAASQAPLREMMSNPATRRSMLVALFAATMPLGVISGLGALAALVFLGGVMKVESQTVYLMMVIALVVASPSYLLAGWLADKVGRRPVIIAGCLLSLLTVVPAFYGMAHLANPALMDFQRTARVEVASDTCGVHIIVTANTDLSDCDKARDLLNKSGVNYVTTRGGDADLKVQIGERTLIGFDKADYQAALADAGLPLKADPARMNLPAIVAVLAWMFVCNGLISGPLSAYLTELFPSRVRYSAVSLPYHVGNGVFGGFLPLVTSALAIATGNIFGGLIYPVVMLSIGAVVALVFLRETYHPAKPAG